MSVRDLIIVDAGPSGLSVAIAAKQSGLDYQVVEQGVLVNSIYRSPPQMVFFTTPELLEIGGLPFVSPYDKPTRPDRPAESTASATRAPSSSRLDTTTRRTC
jgi:thioredoxin reductase (NADPH)